MLALASGSLLGATAATVVGAPAAPAGKYVGGVSVLEIDDSEIGALDTVSGLSSFAPPTAA